MAILKREGAHKVYAVARLFREQALERDGSLLTPGVAIWTAAALDDLHERFVLQPDSSSDAFEVKLERQLAGASDTTIQLMAELLLMHFLVNSNMSGAAKRTGIRRVLGWMQNPAVVPENVDAALDYGLAWPGTFFNTGRDRHLRFLIDWMRSWKQLTTAARETALSDPWAFKEQLYSVDVYSAWLQRNVMLHFVFPDTFERTIARNDKSAVIRTFAHLIGGPEAAAELDEDRAILMIREALAQEYGPDFDFYDTDNVVVQWNPRKKGTELAEDGAVPLLDLVRKVYPAWSGFDDQEFIDNELEYKRVASEKARALLGEAQLRELIDARQFEEVMDRIRTVAQATNLLWMRVPQQSDIAILTRQDLDKGGFARALLDLLHGPGASPERLERYARWAAERGMPCTWAMPTYLLMLVHPDADYFVKPQATKWFLREMGEEPKIGAKPTAAVYERVLAAATAVYEALAEYGPADLMDVQGYVWTAYRAPDEGGATGVLAEPFATIFGDWDTAWWSFDVARKALEEAGVAGPEDERLAVTLVGGPSIHVDVSSWLLLAFGRDQGKSKHLGAAIAKGSALHQQIGGGDGFAADPSVTVGYLPLAEARAQEPDLWEAMSPALDSARALFAGHRGSSYRVHNRSDIAEAIFDDAKRERLFSEGIIMPKPQSGTVYDYIRSQGYHFPDWLVTDYVLSLATKPLVILSGISGTGKTKMAQLVSEFVAPAQDREIVVEASRAPGSEGAVRVSIRPSAFEHRRLTIPNILLDGMVVPAPNSISDLVVRAGGQRFEARLYAHAAARNYQVHMKPALYEWFKVNAEMGDLLELNVVPVIGDPEFELELAVVRSDRRVERVPSERIAFLSVRPDWTDNRALLGYFNPLLQRYQGTELLRLLLRAEANPDEPHFVVLDEMNLAKAEYYFSDFLSAMESGTEMVLHDADDDEVETEELLPPRRLKVPRNVFFTGTVNVDETTYMFSPKVLDRANTIEFNQVDLLAYGRGGAELADAFRLRDGITLDALLAASRQPGPQDWTALSAAAQDPIRAIHSLMEEYNLHFGYRVANEIARYLALTKDFVGDDQLDFALDLQVLQKVLPKLSGSRAKLERPLEALLEHLEGEGLLMSAAKVERMLSTVRAVGFVSFVE